MLSAQNLLHKIAVHRAQRFALQTALLADSYAKHAELSWGQQSSAELSLVYAQGLISTYLIMLLQLFDMP